MKCPICEKELNKFIFEDIKEKLYQCKNCFFTFKILSNKINITIKDNSFILFYTKEKYSKKKEKIFFNKIQNLINIYRKKLKKKKIKYFLVLKKRCCYCKNILSINKFYRNKNTYDRHSAICKKCAKKYNKKYNKRFTVWLRNSYHTMSQRQKRKFNTILSFNISELNDWVDKELWNELWNEYKLNNYQQKYQVCIARKKYDEDYNLNNLKLQTYSNVCLEALRKIPMSKRKIPTRKCIGQYENGKLIKIWNSIREAERELNCDSSSIVKVCKGKFKTHHGWRWRYL